MKQDHSDAHWDQIHGDEKLIPLFHPPSRLSAYSCSVLGNRSRYLRLSISFSPLFITIS
jgi:hypothetical protein